MTVKHLRDYQKEMIVHQYQAKIHNQKELAAAFATSERTINRVLNEAGVLTAVPRLKGEAYQAAQLLKKFGMSAAQLSGVIEHLCKVGSVRFVHDDAIIEMPAPTHQQIIAAAVKMEDGTWSALLNDILTARVAAQHTQHVQTAMLNLQQKVDATNRKNQDKK